MSNYIGKQLSSRPLLTSTSTTTAIKSSAQTYQLRVITTTSGNLSIADTSSTATSAAATTVPIVANVAGEYFTITPGQWYTLAAAMSVTEMT
jgi:hypothetical protein